MRRNVTTHAPSFLLGLAGLLFLTSCGIGGGPVPAPSPATGANSQETTSPSSTETATNPALPAAPGVARSEDLARGRPLRPGTEVGTGTNVGSATNVTTGVVPIAPILPGGVPNANALLSLTVTPANASIAPGQMQQFTATGYFSRGGTANLTASVVWTSSAPGVATINAAGLTTTVESGSTTITATYVTATPFGPAPGVTPGTPIVVSLPMSPISGSTTLTGIGPLVSVNNTSLTFSSQDQGTTSAAQSVTLTNTGNASLTITNILLTGSDPGDFALNQFHIRVVLDLPVKLLIPAGCPHIDVVYVGLRIFVLLTQISCLLERRHAADI